jgi:hypothetical protein
VQFDFGDLLTAADILREQRRVTLAAAALTLPPKQAQQLMDLLSELKRTHGTVELETAVADFRERERELTGFAMPEPLDPEPEGAA